MDAERYQKAIESGIERLIVELWKAVTSVQWNTVLDTLLIMMRVTKGTDTFDELHFLFGVASRHCEVAFREELNNA